MTSASKPNAVAIADTSKSPEKRIKPPQLSRYSSDTDFDDLIAHVDTGDMCENLELLRLHEDEVEKKKQASLSEDKPRMPRQSSNWSFSLGSFDDSYSEDVSAAIEEYSTGTTSREDDVVDASHLSANFISVVNIPKQTISNSSPHNTTTLGSSIHSKYQSSFRDIDSDTEEDEQ